MNSVSEFSDVSPDDWAYEALRYLVEQYGCIEGYPDNTFRGNRALTRYEFAAGLNSCLQQIERLTAANAEEEGKERQEQQPRVAPEDLETLEKLVREFQAELATLGTRVDNLEARTETIEENQFSTTTQLDGEVIFAISDVFGDEVEDDINTVFQDRVRLNFETSFTGEDLLRTRIQARNVGFGDVGGATLGTTNEGELAFAGDNENDVELDELFYEFPVADVAEVQVWANAGDLDDIADPLNPLESSGSGSISNFGQHNPIYNLGGQDVGAGVTFGGDSPLRISAAYLAGEAPDPSSGAGLFNGAYSAIGQVVFQPSDRFQIAGVYVHAYGDDAGTGSGSTGSSLAVEQPDDSTRPVVSNAYGIEASLGITDNIILTGWGGYNDAIILGRGNAEVWNYAATLAIQDFGTEGSTLGFVVGQQPKLTEVDGSVVGLEEDEDTGLHVEGFYKWQLSDNIAITPGVIWLTAPGHNDDNDDVFISTIRTTFSF